MRLLTIRHDRALEQLVRKSTRRVVILDLVLSRAQDLVKLISPFGIRNYSALKLSIHVSRKLTLNSKTAKIDFKRGIFTEIRGILKRKVKGNPKRLLRSYLKPY